MADETATQQQYPRKCQLFVSGAGLKGTDNAGKAFDGFDLSTLRIKFSVKTSDYSPPNTADIRVYNVEQQTALAIYTALNPFTGNPSRGQVLLQAGYDSNYGVIFQGNIKQIILGRESATDTFIDIVAGDGDRAYNYAVVNTTLKSGSTQSDQVFASVKTMADKGVTLGHTGQMSTYQLPRGKVMYGNARNYLKNVANNENKSWSIQNGQVTFVSNTSYLPGERVVLTSATGLIGTPSQTNSGVNVKCLLNPRIRCGGLVDIDNASVQDFKIDLQQVGTAASVPAPLSPDGVYYVLVTQHSGDTRGVDWYTTVVCLNTNVTVPVGQSIPVGNG